MPFKISTRIHFIGLSLLVHAGAFYYVVQYQSSSINDTDNNFNVVYQFNDVNAAIEKQRPTKTPEEIIQIAKQQHTNNASISVEKQHTIEITKNLNPIHQQINKDPASKKIEHIAKLIDADVINLEPKQPSTQTISHPIKQQATKQALAMIESRYTHGLLQAIEQHKHYPLRARRKGEEGDVELTFSILKDGEITAIQVTSSSGFTSLDQASSSALETLAHFKPIPWQLGRESWNFQVPVSFKLN